MLPRERQTVWFQGIAACSPLAGVFDRRLSTVSYFFCNFYKLETTERAVAICGYRFFSVYLNYEEKQ